jgi:hypothetical protein
MPSFITRLKWNDNQWQRPAKHTITEQTRYIRTHGFGFEEWLNRAEWKIAGWRYAFIQGVYKSRARRAGQQVDLMLYSVSPAGERVFVGILRKARILEHEEAVDGRRTPNPRGRLASAILSRSLSMPAELIVGDHRIPECSPASSAQGAGGMPAPSALVDPTGPTGGLLFAEHPGCGFCCLGILDDRIQFDINQVAPIVHMLGEGGHIVRFQDVPAQNRAGDVIPSNLFHSLGRRTAGFEKLLKRRLVEAGARSPREHEFHGYTLLTSFEVWSGRRNIRHWRRRRLTSLSHKSCLVAMWRLTSSRRSVVRSASVDTYGCSAGC